MWPRALSLAVPRVRSYRIRTPAIAPAKDVIEPRIVVRTVAIGKVIARRIVAIAKRTHAARWRWNRPYRWATWGAIAGFFPWGWGSSVSYNYGDNVYYEGDEVYYGDEAVATTEEYAEQAQDLAASAPEVDDSADWMTLGVFAITQDGEASGAPPTLFVQLAVNKQGIIAGTFQNTADGESKEVEGMIDQKSQRSAWALAGTSWPIMETGIANLTEDTAAALVHFENGETQQWLLVRLEEPKEGS